MGKIQDHPIWSKVIGSAVFAVLGSAALYCVPGGWPWVFEKIGHIGHEVFTWLEYPRSFPTWAVILATCLFAVVAYKAVILWGEVNVQKFKSVRSASEIHQILCNGINFHYKIADQKATIISYHCEVCGLELRPKSTRYGEGTKFYCENCISEVADIAMNERELKDTMKRRIELEHRKQSG